VVGRVQTRAHEQRQVERSQHDVGERKREGLSTRCRLDRRRNPDDREHRGEHDGPIDDVIVVEGVCVPGEPHPRPPERHKQGDIDPCALPRGIAMKCPCQSRNGHDKAQIEEQFEPRCRPVSLVRDPGGLPLDRRWNPRSGGLALAAHAPNSRNSASEPAARPRQDLPNRW